MVVETQAQATIRATPERVFDVTNDLDRIADAFVAYGPIPGTVSAEVIGGGALVQGVSRRVHTSDGHHVIEEMLIFDRAAAVAYKLTGISAPFSWLVRFARADWSFETVPEGTRVRWTYAFTLTTPLVWPVAAPMLHMVFRRWMYGCLEAIARIAERES